MLPPAGQVFEKRHLPDIFEDGYVFNYNDECPIGTFKNDNYKNLTCSLDGTNYGMKNDENCPTTPTHTMYRVYMSRGG